MPNHITEPETATAVRTLLAAGFTIARAHRQPAHIEIKCSRVDVLGANIPYLICISERDEFMSEQLKDLARTANSEGRVLIVVAGLPGNGWISWDDFTEALGGAIPTWQALNSTYLEALLAAGMNRLPAGQTGEPWLIFEDLVASGLEFVFGRRVRRLGGRTRGRRVSDMNAQIPQGEIIAVDAKASETGFNAGLPALRPLIEYVKTQRDRQQGQVELIGALVVSSSFQQETARLEEISRQFFAESRVPVSFMASQALGEIVAILSERPDARNGILWSRLLTGTTVSAEGIMGELRALDLERVSRGG